MSLVYEQMDVESANLVGTYESEAEALAVVRAAIDARGPSSITGLALGYEDDEGNGALIAEGAGLAERALALRARKLKRPT